MNDPADLTGQCLAVLERARARAVELGVTERALEIRTAEFLLLITKLRANSSIRMGTVLEIGCGRGYSLLLWSQVSERVTGCDVDQEAEIARKLVGSFEGRVPITVLTRRAEEVGGLGERFDLVVTQYVLEHLDDLDASLRAMRSVLAPGGHVVHVVPGVVDRADWYIGYRAATSWYRRIVHVLRERGIPELARGALRNTPPHAPEFGAFEHELSEYRLERWALRFMKAGFEIVDYFASRDGNWAIVTRARTSAG